MDVSVVIGFKDWGLDRLDLSLESILASLQDYSAEIIVVDYGSADRAANQSAIEREGVRYLYVETDGVWSRSRALNAGVAVSTGRILITTDADMLFTPLALSKVISELQVDPQQALVLQCRDLPEAYSSEGVRTLGVDWQHFEAVSRLRPRWGMGGMMAVSRSAFLDVRGFDERMEVYGGEDIDFANRVRRSGRRVRWVEDPDVRMFHMWHPSSRAATESDPLEAQAVKRNSQILTDDESFVRNTTQWEFRPDDAPVLASVVICTRNRAEFLAESIYSALGQTVQDIEVIVIDDGSDDDTAEVVGSIEDERLRYVYQEKKGLAAGRNLAATLAKGRYTVIHDDDDIMFPDRIERHFAALSGGVQGTYGGWVDFANNNVRDYKMYPGKEFISGIVQFTGEVFLHPTLMIETALIQEIPYDRSLRSGSDFSLAVRMSRSGVVLKHMGSFAIMRRLHDRQVTHADSNFQQASWAFTKSVGMQGLGPAQVKFMKKSLESATVTLPTPKDVHQLLNLALPDHLANRTARISLTLGKKIPDNILNSGRFGGHSISSDDGQILGSAGVLEDASLQDLYELRSAGLQFEIVGPSKKERSKVEVDASLQTLVGRVLYESGPEVALLVVRLPARLEDEMPEQLCRSYVVEVESAQEFVYVMKFDDYLESVQVARWWAEVPSCKVVIASQQKLASAVGK